MKRLLNTIRNLLSIPPRHREPISATPQMNAARSELPADALDPLKAYYEVMKAKGAALADPGILIFDETRAQTLKPYAEAEATALSQGPFDPEHNENDATLDRRHKHLGARLLELQQQHLRCEARAQKLRLEMPHRRPRPRPAPGFVALAVTAIGAAFSLSFLPLFASIDDPVLKLTAAITTGGVVAAFAVAAILGE